MLALDFDFFSGFEVDFGRGETVLDVLHCDFGDLVLPEDDFIFERIDLGFLDFAFENCFKALIALFLRDFFEKREFLESFVESDFLSVLEVSGGFPVFFDVGAELDIESQFFERRRIAEDFKVFEISIKFWVDLEVLVQFEILDDALLSEIAVILVDSIAADLD